MEKIKKIVTKYFQKGLGWIKENPLEAFFLFAILALAAFLRLYKISGYMTFLGDEGRDAIIVRRLLVNRDLILIGPGTSIGNMYLGPLYYYLIAPSLFLANYSPAGPAIFIAVLGIATVFFVYWIGREWFGRLAGAIAAFLYSLSSVVIIYSRSSWNPNIMPFFALVCIYATWQVWAKKNWKWLLALGISFGFVLQSHYLGLLLLPTIGLFWLVNLFEIRRQRQDLHKYLKYSALSLFIFTFLMSPLVIFDARHGWNNFGAMEKFFVERQTTVSVKPWKAIPKLIPLSEKITARLITGKDTSLGTPVTIAFFLGALWLLLDLAKKKLKGIDLRALAITLTWLGFAVLGLGLYKQEIYDHYYGFFFAAPFLLIGLILSNLSKKGPLGKVITICIVVLLVILSLKDNPLRYPPNNQLARTQEVATKMQAESADSAFNLAVIAERNYEGAYQYFLESRGGRIIEIDPQKAQETIKEQLFVVCEIPKEKCDPTHSPKAQIANFGWSRIDREWEVGGVILYKLVHAQ